MKIAILATSASEIKWSGGAHKTGCWLHEVAAPYYVFKDLGNEVHIVSVKGGEIPWDPLSLTPDYVTSEVKRFQMDEEAQKAVKNSISMQEFDFSAIDALFFPGGHGTVVDFYKNNDIAQIVNEVWNTGKVIGAVCHGPIALLGAKNEKSEPLLKGLRCTGFSNDEENAVNLMALSKEVADSVEDAERSEGGLYEKGPNMWGSYVVTDGSLVTGENPASSKDCAEAVIAALDAKN